MIQTPPKFNERVHVWHSLKRGRGSSYLIHRYRLQRGIIIRQDNILIKLITVGSLFTEYLQPPIVNVINSDQQGSRSCYLIGDTLRVTMTLNFFTLGLN